MVLGLAFAAGYLLISLERVVRVEKAAIALLTGVACWLVLALGPPLPGHGLATVLVEQLGDIASILLFLLGAMTMVEVMDRHGAFSFLSDRIRISNQRWLLVVVSLVCFGLSALLDNLTTTIVMISVVRKLVCHDRDRLFFSAMIVIAANAGGVFSPVGDVTTTMLWIGGQVSAGGLVTRLFLPSLAALVLPLALMMTRVSGQPESCADLPPGDRQTVLDRRVRGLVLVLGMALIVMVPVGKILTGLPPFMLMLGALGLMWAFTEIFHRRAGTPGQADYSVQTALSEIDLPSILFFAGILLAVAALQAGGLLGSLAAALDAGIGSASAVMPLLGLVSAVVDNVPLVAAAMKMYAIQAHPMDSQLWLLLAYCAGTGGSLLIIGSAAGVGAMGASRIGFGWYLRQVSWMALLGYAAGIGVFFLQGAFLG